MPRIWRGMFKDEADGKPQVGSDKKMLGSRIGSQSDDDIPETDGKVVPQTGGMSVAPSLDTLPGHRLPRRLKPLIPRASGPNSLLPWYMGDGPFDAGPLANGLAFRPDPLDPERHGFVEPAEEMTADAYQNAIAETKPLWTTCEELE